MTTQANLLKFKTEIEQVVRFAKRVGYNLETGNFNDLMSAWLEDGRKTQVFLAEQRDVALPLLKKMVK